VSLALAVFWLSVAALGYTWLGYPALLRLRGRRREPEPGRGGAAPDVSVIVAAFNEARCIVAKLDSTLARQRYPQDRLEAIVVSDGSTDGTDALVAAYPDRRVRLIRQEPRSGKSPPPAGRSSSSPTPTRCSRPTRSRGWPPRSPTRASGS
jgi:cellulose synthase/poly-beta-1,6-N-acetylglucosamine synthase-like glycosyltransferase